MKIQVLGSGCLTCKKMFETTQKIANELDIKSEVEYVDDVAKMLEMGVMQSPVLAVDGQVVLTGGGHSEDDIKKALSEKCSLEENDGCCSCCSC